MSLQMMVRVWGLIEELYKIMSFCSSAGISALATQILNKTEGYKALRMGGVFYLISCAPVKAFVAELSYCCQEIPAIVSGRLPFADPITHTLSYNCTVVKCTRALPAMYEFENTTLCASPGVTQCDPPKWLDPNGVNETSLFLGKTMVFVCYDMSCYSSGTASRSFKNFLPQELIDGIDLITRYTGNQRGFMSSVGHLSISDGTDGSAFATQWNKAIGGQLKILFI